ncbi:MAG: T9SS type A sorting domain-containing protein [Bacteroidales bacterium]|nr:T9SS type A sorting domain-containing protein [Bacteroidales bacterium]
MRNLLYKCLGVLAMLLVMAVEAVFAQDADTIRMMQYNLMYYTNSSGISDCNSLSNNLDTKDANIKTIFQYVKPTVFCVCELGSQNQYADRLLNNAINTDGINYYRRGPLTNQSGGTIANMIYYDSRKLTLYKSNNITTSYRDINGYTFYYNANDLGVGDTIFTTFWIAHLKAGSNSSNEEARLVQVQKLMSRIANSGLPGNYTLSGDFNIYSSDEPAYQTLTEYPNSLYRFYDPVNSPGYWHNNPQFSSLHTQSTHTQEADCFSDGGLDDRFDIILVSPYIYYGSDRIHIVEGSYHALGQDGARFNGTILSPVNNSIPSNVAHALFQQSDHLPVIMDMTIDAHVGVPVYKPDFQIKVANPVRETLFVELQNDKADDYDISVYAADGSLVMNRHEHLDTGLHRLTYSFDFRKGIYLVTFTNKSGQKIIKKLIHF